MKKLGIQEVGVRKDGCLYIRPILISDEESKIFEFVYRAGMGIYWDKNEKHFHSSSPADKAKTSRDWFDQILKAVKEELGYSLESSKDTIWTGVASQLKS